MALDCRCISNLFVVGTFASWLPRAAVESTFPGWNSSIEPVSNAEGDWPDAAPQRCPKHPTEHWKNAHASLPPVTSLAKRSIEATVVARFPERTSGHEGHH